MRKLILIAVAAYVCLWTGALLLRSQAVTNIYYSVGQNTNDHKSGSPTITLASGAATFSVAQTATNLGRGDLVTYSGGTCYLGTKTDTSHWTCLTALGANPSNVSGAAVSSIAHAFASLYAAVDKDAEGAVNASHLNTADLVAGGFNLFIVLYRDAGSDTSPVWTKSTWVTDATHGLTIYTPTNTATECNLSQRHAGIWDATAGWSLVSSGANPAIALDTGFVTLRGVQVKNASGTTGNASAIRLYRPHAFVDASIFSSAADHAILSGESTNEVRNSVVPGGANGPYDYDQGAWNNLTVGGVTGSGFTVAGSHPTLNNVYIGGSGTADITGGGASGWYCSSVKISDNSDTSQAGCTVTKNVAYSTVAGAKLTSVTSGAESFLPVSGSSLIDTGAALGYLPAVDIRGIVRPQGSGWDIGAFEPVSTATAGRRRTTVTR